MLVGLRRLGDGADRLAGRRAALAGGGALLLTVGLWTDISPESGGTSIVFISFIMVGFWLAGRVVRSRSVLMEEIAERTRELEVEREERARLAVAEERARIARELHDVVAHTLSVIVVQAGAERLVTADDGARETLAAIERTSRDALAEMGCRLGMLRTEGSGSDLDPQPSLARIDELLAGVRATGLEVELVVEGETRRLPIGMNVSAYRIVQEALTNSLKHGRCTRARVRLSWDHAFLEIEVADDGIGPAAAPRAGHGLLGLRERVALFGGHPRHGSQRSRRRRPHGAATPPTGVTAIRVLIADDQPLVRAGLRKIVETDAAITVAGEAEDGARDRPRGLSFARRRADGHPHAHLRRDRGNPAAARAWFRRAGRRTHDVRPGRLRARRPPGGGQRLPPQGIAGRGDPARDPRRGRR